MSFISFDTPRRRPAPSVVAGEVLRPDDLVVAVKNDCDGCEVLLNSDLSSRIGRRVFFVARESVAGHDDVLVDPAFFDAADVPWPPLAMLLGGDPLEIVNECVPFGPEHLIETLGL